MTAERDTSRIVRSWLRTDEHESADAILGIVLSRLDTTPQRRSWWPAWRHDRMNLYTKAAATAAAGLVVAVIGYNLLPQNGSQGAHPSAPPSAVPTPSLSPTPSPAATPAAFHQGPLTAGTYVMTPFSGMPNASTVCMPAAPGCVEDPADDSIRVTLTVPDGYGAVGERPLIWGPEAATGLIILRGSGLYADPCNSRPPPDIAVGPTVDDFADAIAAHPLLDASRPVPVTLAGYSGKYVDLQLPADVTTCKPNGEFWPFEPGVYAQGPSHRWHLWILDVEGLRVVIQSMDYPTTPPQQVAELQAIVDSIQIDPS